MGMFSQPSGWRSRRTCAKLFHESVGRQARILQDSFRLDDEGVVCSQAGLR